MHKHEGATAATMANARPLQHSFAPEPRLEVLSRQAPLKQPQHGSFQQLVEIVPFKVGRAQAIQGAMHKHRRQAVGMFRHNGVHRTQEQLLLQLIKHTEIEGTRRVPASTQNQLHLSQ